MIRPVYGDRIEMEVRGNFRMCWSTTTGNMMSEKECSKKDCGGKKKLVDPGEVSVFNASVEIDHSYFRYVPCR